MDTSDETDTWIEWFCAQRGNEFLCEIDSAFIEDAFNLYGLRSLVPHFRDCLEMILDITSERDRDDWSGALFEHAKDLYGLIHARFILTSRGMVKMLHKYEDLEFGHCPNVACQNYPVLPVGLSNELRVELIKLYCPRCESVYRSSYHDAPSSLDGAFFGTTFPHLLLLLKPGLAPPKSPWRYVPRIYGFRVYGRVGSRAAGVLERIEEEEQAKEAEGARATALMQAIEDAQNARTNTAIVPVKAAAAASSSSSSSSSSSAAASASAAGPAVADAATATVSTSSKAVKRSSRPDDAAETPVVAAVTETLPSEAAASAEQPSVAAAASASATTAGPGEDKPPEGSEGDKQWRQASKKTKQGDWAS